MTKEKIDAIIAEATSYGLAFVEDRDDDTFFITESGEELYSPIVDHDTALQWLREKLEEL